MSFGRQRSAADDRFDDRMSKVVTRLRTRESLLSVATNPLEGCAFPILGVPNTFSKCRFHFSSYLKAKDQNKDQIF